VRRKRNIAERTSRPSTKYAPQSMMYAISPSAAVNTYGPTRLPSREKRSEDSETHLRQRPATASARANPSSSYPALFTPVPLGFAFAAFDKNPLLPPPTPVC
jgi:hypothetical protein